LAALAVAALALSYTLGAVPSLIAWLALAGMTCLFRDPVREVPSSPLAVVSPVDGSVLRVEDSPDPWLRRDMIRIVVKTGFTDVYSLRGPTEGKILQHWSERPGDGATGIPRQYAYWLQTDEEDDVVFAMSSRLAFPGFSCSAHVGERVGQGQRIGYLYFGAEVDLYLPQGSTVGVIVGDRVLAGSSVLGSFVHKPTDEHFRAVGLSEGAP
jgi:phosphatidylserine decarboxylase